MSDKQQTPITVEPSDIDWEPNFDGIDLRAIHLKPGTVVMLTLPDEMIALLKRD